MGPLWEGSVCVYCGKAVCVCTVGGQCVVYCGRAVCVCTEGGQCVYCGRAVCVCVLTMVCAMTLPRCSQQLQK